MRWLVIPSAVLTMASGMLSIHMSPATAEIHVPPGLNPGDPYHLAFVSSTVRDAYSADITDYDAHVQAAADAAGIGVTEGVSWYAIGSTSFVDARDHAAVSAPVHRLDGVKIADGYADLWDGTILAPLFVTELGDSSESEVWTGTDRFGVASNPLGAPVYNWVEWGRCLTSDTDFRWLASGMKQPHELLPLYALSEQLVVVPEPSSSLLILTAASLVVVYGAYRRRR